MDIIGKRKIFFAISLLLIVPGVVALFVWGLRPGIDFTGGSKLEYKVSSIKYKVSNEGIRKNIQASGVEVGSIQKSGKDIYIIRTKPIDQKTNEKIKTGLKNKFVNVKEISFETVGPTIGTETAINAVKAVAIASVLIVFYIAWAFRKVPKPASSFRFGICAVAALIHDVLVLIGVFAILGHFLGVEVDSLFVTAVLTVIGFSVHDTIVVFDRVRENLIRNPSAPFERVVNDSILQTLGRSVNTSITVVLVLFTMLLFGGESIRWFVVALLIGIISGTYSSIFNATPLLVVWEEFARKRNAAKK